MARRMLGLSTMFFSLFQEAPEKSERPWARKKKLNAPKGYGFNGRGDLVSAKRHRRRAVEATMGKLSGRQWVKLRKAGAV